MSPEKIGLVFIILSRLLYAGFLIVPFTPFALSRTVALSAGLVIGGESRES